MNEIGKGRKALFYPSSFGEGREYFRGGMVRARAYVHRRWGPYGNGKACRPSLGRGRDAVSTYGQEIKEKRQIVSTENPASVSREKKG